MKQTLLKCETASSLLLSTLLVCLLAPGGVVKAGPFEDGRLFLHVQPGESYSPKINPVGRSGTPLCGEAVTSVPRGVGVVLVFVVAAFPGGQVPTLHGISFGLEYDPARLEIIDSGNQAYGVEQTTDWPGPGSSTHLLWKLEPTGQSIEIYWFAVRPIGGLNSRLRLTPGVFGGRFFGLDGEEIDGFGSLGFGVAGALDCPPEGTCCLPDGSCSLVTEGWCLQAGGYFSGHPQDCSTCDPVGACCHDWTCTVTLEEVCTLESGVFAGEGSACEPNVCIPMGACCQTDGKCSVVRGDECIPSNFLPGALCDPSPCSTFGACCLEARRSCQLLAGDDCLIADGDYLGDGTVCGPAVCQIGLCCFNHDSDCRYSTVVKCEGDGGSFNEGYYGPIEEACSVCCCPATIAASWGSLKSRFRESAK